MWKTAQAPEILSATNATQDAGGTVPATLSLTLGTAASFGAFTPGVQRDYDASTTANVISTAGDADADGRGRELDRHGPSRQRDVLAPAGAAGRRRRHVRPVGGSAAPTTLKTYTAPVSNDSVAVNFRQRINANDALRTGAYSKTLTFTLSTTAP